MSLSIISLLQGETQEKLPRKNWEWWLDKFAQNDTLFMAFKNAINNTSHKTPDEVSKEWIDIFNELIEWKWQLTDVGKVGERHWTQAVKFYVCAKLVVDKKTSKHPTPIQTLISKENENTLAGELKTAIDSSSEEFVELKKELENSIVEMMLLVKLFVQETNWNWVKVPVVEARINKDNQTTGKFYNLMLKKVLTFGEVMPNPTFLDNLAEDMEEDFLESVINAFHYNREFWKRIAAKEHKNWKAEQEKWKKVNQEKDFGEFGFIWDLIPFEVENNNLIRKDTANAEPEKEEKRGESAGLAAAVGIYHALLNQFPEDRVIYSARLESKGFDSDLKTPKLTGRIKPVESVLAKITAAVNPPLIDLIDTFVIHQDNFKDGDLDTQEIKRLIDKNLPFRVKTLDDEGEEKATYPPEKDKQELSFDV